MDRIEILSTHNLLCLKFAAVCRKVSTSCHAHFLSRDASGPRYYSVHDMVAWVCVRLMHVSSYCLCVSVSLDSWGLIYKTS